MRLAGLAAALAIVTSSGVGGAEERKLYVVAVSHLDTQWWWDIQETITDHIPATFEETFKQLETYQDYNFSWEGAFRYMLLKEYYPDLYAELKEWVTAGRWAPAGSAIEGGDVNVPSPESLMRQFLYGSSFFRKEFGVTGLDVFLPDCFGFGYALPSVAAHCGLKGFSTQKLSWGSAQGMPFEIGVWEGPDGESVVAVLNPGSYIGSIKWDLSEHGQWGEECDAWFDQEQQRVGYRYFGIGDQGGPAPEQSVAKLQASIDGDGPVEVVSAFSDQFFRDLTPSHIAQLPHYQGELLLTTHGTGAYTSQAAMKRLNRRNELLGAAAEQAAVAAEWLGGSPYPAEKLTDAWIRFLVHQFHDDITGTGIPEIYAYSWNDEFIALNRFASVLTESAGAVARALDTAVEGVPLVVYNALAFKREDVVEAVVRYAGAVPDHVRVYGPKGEEVPSQLLATGDGFIEVAIVASVPSSGYAVFDVREADAPCQLDTALSVSESALENERYRVELNAAGDLARVYDKLLAEELLTAPARIGLFDDLSGEWPGWELLWSDIEAGPREHVGGDVKLEVLEDGPARVALRVTRSQAGSSYRQVIRLGAGDAGHRVEVDTQIDWATPSTFSKLIFPLASANPVATYDLGLGVIERGNNAPNLYEVPAQQWADLTATDGSWGVSVLNDCKYGWDKPDDETLRLTLLHTPFPSFISAYYGHDTQDIGPHRVLYGLYGHEDDWRNGSVRQAKRLNQPLIAFQTGVHPGELGRTFSFLKLTSGMVEVEAVKRGEAGDEYIVRVREAAGKSLSGIHLEMGDGIETAREVDGTEQPVGAVELVDRRIVFDLKPYQPRTFAVTLRPPPVALTPPSSRTVSLDYDTDVASLDSARGDGEFDFAGGLQWTLPGELLPGQVANGGAIYQMGSAKAGANNAVACAGQSIPLEPLPGDRLYVLAAATDDSVGLFDLGGETTKVEVQQFSGFVGQWDSRVVDGEVLTDPALFVPGFLKLDPIAWYGTHRHAKAGNDPYLFTYLFQYVLSVPEGASEVVLPDNQKIRVLALSLVNDPNDRTVAAREANR